MSMNYQAYANELSNKLQQAVMAGAHADLCPESEAFDDTAVAVSEILQENGLAVSREVFFCKLGKGGRIDVCIIVDGVTDEAVIHRLNMEHHRVDGGEIVEMGESNIQAYFAEDTDWPEAFYASGEPDEFGMQMAELLKQFR